MQDLNTSGLAKTISTNKLVTYAPTFILWDKRKWLIDFNVIIFHGNIDGMWLLSFCLNIKDAFQPSGDLNRTVYG